MQASNDSRAITHILMPEANMNTLSNRNLVSVPRVSAARDIVRIVIAAVLAGTGFAMLMALVVLSLTVISPPAQASGAPALTSSGSADMARATEDRSEAPAGTTFIAEAAAAQPLPTAVSAIRSDEAPAASLPSLPKLAALALVLALLVGAAVLVVRARSRQ
jgi:hypothetical protein